MAGDERSGRGDNRLAQPLEPPDTAFASGQRVATTLCAGPMIDGRSGSSDGAEGPATERAAKEKAVMVRENLESVL